MAPCTSDIREVLPATASALACPPRVRIVLRTMVNAYVRIYVLRIASAAPAIQKEFASPRRVTLGLLSVSDSRRRLGCFPEHSRCRGNNKVKIT